MIFTMVLAAAGVSCSTRKAPIVPSPKAHLGSGMTQQLTIIDPVEPSRDFYGPPPKQFQWTAVKGADRYAIGIFNEVDLIMWRDDDVPTNSIAWPEGLRLDAGTYFWQVTALSGERAIGDSGRTAFVVMQ